MRVFFFEVCAILLSIGVVFAMIYHPPGVAAICGGGLILVVAVRFLLFLLSLRNRKRAKRHPESEQEQN